MLEELASKCPILIFSHLAGSGLGPSDLITLSTLGHHWADINAVFIYLKQRECRAYLSFFAFGMEGLEELHLATFGSSVLGNLKSG